MTYSLRLGSLLAVVFACSQSTGQAIRFPMEATDGSDFLVVSTLDLDGTDGNSDGDVFIDFGTDYSTFGVGFSQFFQLPTVAGAPFPAGIPEAPNTQPGDLPHRGHLLDANFAPDSAVVSGARSDIAMLARDPNDNSQLLTIDGNYEVQVDVWMNYQTGSAVATEMGGLLIGHDGLNPGSLSGGGFGMIGDSGAAADFRLLKAPAGGSSVLSGAIGDSSVAYQGLDLQPDGTGGDGQYNPEIGLAYFDDPQFDTGVFNANDNENDFWQDALPLRTDTTFSFSPPGAQGPQGDPTGVVNPPGDPGFRWVTIRMEVEPDTVGNGTRTTAPGIARVYLQATWLDDSVGNGDPADQQMFVGPEVFVGTLDNSIDTPDTQGNAPAVLDFTDPIAVTYSDLFSSTDVNGFGFGVFDNLIITPEATADLLGDADGDGDVDGDDLIAVQTNFGSTGSLPLLGDGDFDGDVDGDDLIAVQTNFGATASVAVPEPTGLALLACAGLFVGARRR